MRILLLFTFVLFGIFVIGQNITPDQLTTSSGILGRSSGSGPVSILDASTTKTFLGLNNVENTALSTWSGSTNIVTLGSITSGTWNATTIAIGKGGTGLTGTPTNGQLLIGNGSGYTLATITQGTGMTVTNGVGTITLTNAGVTSFSAGTTGLTPSTGTTGAVTLAGTLAVANGGTGLSALGSSLQQLRVNAGGTSLEYFTPSAASGDISNGGNTTGATVIIGTNDNNDLAFERNTVTYFTLGNVGVINHNTNTASTNTPVDNISTSANTSGTATLGFGSRIKFLAETATVADREQAAFGGIWTNSNATDASRTSAGVVYAVNNAGSLSEVARFTGATTPTLSIASAMGTAGTTTFGNSGITPGVTFTIGGNTNIITVGGGSGSINISSSAVSTTAISISASDNSGTINLGNTAYTSTSLSKTNLKVTDSYTASSGSGSYIAFEIAPTFNLTSTVTGVQRGIYINPTITSLANSSTFRAIDISNNNSSSFGVYQSGTSTKNIFAGKNAFGSTTAATEVMEITGNSKTTGQYWSALYTLTDAATIALDWNNGNVQTVTLGGNRTFTFANPKS